MNPSKFPMNSVIGVIVSGALATGWIISATGSDPVVGSTGQPPPSATLVQEDIHLTMAEPDLDRLIEDTDIAIVGRIRSVSTPIWNSADGEAWTPLPNARGIQATPLRYRKVDVEIEEMLFSNLQQGPAVGEVITVRFYGDGTNTGAEVDGATPNTVRWNRISGTAELGDRRLFLLRNDGFPMQGPVSSWPTTYQLVDHGRGNWQLEGGKAIQSLGTIKRPLTSLSAMVRAQATRP